MTDASNSHMSQDEPIDDPCEILNHWRASIDAGDFTFHSVSHGCIPSDSDYNMDTVSVAKRVVSDRSALTYPHQYTFFYSFKPTGRGHVVLGAVIEGRHTPLREAMEQLQDSPAMIDRWQPKRDEKDDGLEQFTEAEAAIHLADVEAMTNASQAQHDAAEVGQPVVV